MRLGKHLPIDYSGNRIYWSNLKWQNLLNFPQCDTQNILLFVLLSTLCVKKGLKCNCSERFYMYLGCFGSSTLIPVRNMFYYVYWQAALSTSQKQHFHLRCSVIAIKIISIPHQNEARERNTMRNVILETEYFVIYVKPIVLGL